MPANETEITEKGILLDQQGRITAAGWSRSMLLDYSRNAVPLWRRLWRLKEWDYYLFGNDRYQIALTLADNGYMGMASASVINLEQASEKTTSKIIPFTFGRLEMPPSSDEGDVIYRSKRVSLDFFKTAGKRTLRCKFNDFDDVRQLYVNVTLEQPPMDSLCISLPFKDKPECFYYNHKINCMPVRGTVIYGADRIEFSPEDSMGCLDWGRGVWPYDNRWLWCSASGMVGDIPFGLNMGDGFGDRTAAGENIAIVGGVGYKLGKISISFDPDDHMKPWRFTTPDKRVDLTLEPIIDRFADPGVFGIIASVQHQVFGKYYGTVRVADDKLITLDGLTGFAEEVKNKW